MARLAPFLLAATLIELKPGPDMAYLGLLSVREGFTAGFLTVAGITLGLAACLLASVAGLAKFAAHETRAYRTLRRVGVGYLLWLALDAWRGETRRRSEAPSRPVTAPRLTTLHLLHGQNDKVVPVSQAREGFERLMALGADATLDVAASLGHALHPALMEQAVTRLQTCVPLRHWPAA